MENNRVLRILVVGAGAVGQVYAYYMKAGGAQVGLFVREKYAAECALPLPLFQYRGRRPVPVELSGHQVFTQASEVAKAEWDYVLLTVASDALRGGWLEALVASAPRATWIMLQPGVDDREFLLKLVPEERLIQGMIPIVAYHGPLAGEVLPHPGIVWWIPPFSQADFSGPEATLAPLLALLRRGGFPARGIADVQTSALAATVALGCIVEALRAANWSLAELKRGGRLALAAGAAREGYAVICAKRGVKRSPAAFFLLRALFFRGMLAVSRIAMPFNMETYLRAHFTKVGKQMRQGLDDYIESGRRQGIPVAKLDELRAALR